MLTKKDLILLNSNTAMLITDSKFEIPKCPTSKCCCWCHKPLQANPEEGYRITTFKLGRNWHTNCLKEWINIQRHLTNTLSKKKKHISPEAYNLALGIVTCQERIVGRVLLFKDLSNETGIERLKLKEYINELVLANALFYNPKIRSAKGTKFKLLMSIEQIKKLVKSPKPLSIRKRHPDPKGKSEIVCKGCNETKPFYAKGYCNACYQQEYREHNEHRPLCLVCQKNPSYTKNLCSACYQKVRRWRLKRYTNRTEAKFLSMIDNSLHAKD